MGYFEKATQWVDKNVRSILQSLSFDNYVLAGNSVANMYENVPLQGDLDFWCRDKKKKSFWKLLCELAPFYEVIEIYTSLIVLSDPNGDLPIINIIYTTLGPDATISSFDFDYCRCYWTPKTDIVVDRNFRKSIRTKTIYHPQNITNCRILKALDYGYKFTPYFWRSRIGLLNEIGKEKIGGKQDITRNDLNISYFETYVPEFVVTDKNDISKTLKELDDQYNEFVNESQKRGLPLKVTTLLRFETGEMFQGKLIKKYIKKIIFNNPINNGNYGIIGSIDDSLSNHKNLRFYKEKERHDIALRKRVEPLFCKFESDYLNDTDLPCEDEEGPIVDTLPLELDKSKICDRLKKTPTLCKVIKVKDRQPRVFQLNEEGTAYITIEYLPEDLLIQGLHNFHQLFDLHPKNRHKIIMYEKEVEVPRYSQSYLHTPNDLSHISSSSYMYSGFDTTNNNEELPELVKPFYEYIKDIDNKYNQSIINWYEDNDYIAFHADCKKNWIDNGKVAIVSLYPSEKCYRTMIIKSKTNTSKFKINMYHGMILTMCGTIQEEFLHGFKKDPTNINERISISFRQMKV